MNTEQLQPLDDAVLDTGDGPAVLLLHGAAPGTTAMANFAQLVPAITESRVIAPDLLGFGASPKPDDADYGPQLWADQSWKILDDRGIDRIAIVGNSLGARIALTMALAEPERVRGLVLLSTRVTASPASPAQKLLRDYTPSLAGMERLVRECFVTDQTLVTRDVVRNRYDDSARPGAHEAIQRVFAGLAASGPGPDATALGTITVPTLLMHGREDRIVPAENGTRLAELMPHADLHLLAGTGHWLQIERVHLVNAIIDDFLTRCPL